MTGIGKKFPNSPVFDTVMNASPEVGINHNERFKKKKENALLIKKKVIFKKKVRKQDLDHTIGQEKSKF